MVEFALAIPAFLIFIYGLTATFTWGTAGIVAQEITNETAREYAVTLDADKADRLGRTHLGRWGFLWILPPLSRCRENR